MSTTQRIYETRSRAGEQSLTVTVGDASVTVTVDYGRTPPMIVVAEGASEYWSSSALWAHDDDGPARWGPEGWNGARITEQEQRDLAVANRVAMCEAAKRWRVFRRRLSEATAA